MKHAVYGPNLATTTEAMHVHAASCKDTQRKLYHGHQPLLIETDSMKDIVLATYDPGDFEYDPKTEWSDYAQDFKVYSCCSKRLRTHQTGIQEFQEAKPSISSENPKAQKFDTPKGTSNHMSNDTVEDMDTEQVDEAEVARAGGIRPSKSFKEQAEHVLEFAKEHRDDKKRQWAVIADHWTVEDIEEELANCGTRVRSNGGARRHFDWMVRMDQTVPRPDGSEVPNDASGVETAFSDD